MGAALTAQGQFGEAIEHLQRAVELAPQDPWAHFRLGMALSGRGDSRAALAELDEAVRIEDFWFPILGQTAWFLATNPDPSVRNGPRAVELAQRAIQFSQGQDPQAFNALAAGLAETGDFEAAIKAAQQAALVAMFRNDAALAEAIGARTRLYRQRLPYRQPAARSSDQPTPGQ